MSVVKGVRSRLGKFQQNRNSFSSFHEAAIKTNEQLLHIRHNMQLRSIINISDSRDHSHSLDQFQLSLSLLDEWKTHWSLLHKPLTSNRQDKGTKKKREKLKRSKEKASENISQVFYFLHKKFSTREKVRQKRRGRGGMWRLRILSSSQNKIDWSWVFRLHFPSEKNGKACLYLFHKWA